MAPDDDCSSGRSVPARHFLSRLLCKLPSQVTAGAKIFLLSPASASGLRARQLGAPGARFPAAERLRSGEGVSLEEAFSFMSALYFRGKVAYARRFAAPPPQLPGEGILIIAPARGGGGGRFE
jgi:hypothetical protein